MNNALSSINLKDFIPIIVAVFSAIIAYILGKTSEKNKKMSSMAEDSLAKFITKMYKEVIDITNVNNYNIRKIKKFIMKYSSSEDIYKLYDDELNSTLFDLSVKIRNSSITNERLKKEFKSLSIKIENYYWDRLIASSKDFKWWILKNVGNKWYSIIGDIVFILKGSIEYIFVISVLISFLCFCSQLANWTFHNGILFSENIIYFVYFFTCFLGSIYFILVVAHQFFSYDKNFKRRKLVKTEY